jgi:hypothetical protein
MTSAEQLTSQFKLRGWRVRRASGMSGFLQMHVRFRRFFCLAGHEAPCRAGRVYILPCWKLSVPICKVRDQLNALYIGLDVLQIANHKCAIHTPYTLYPGYHRIPHLVSVSGYLPDIRHFQKNIFGAPWL